MRDTFVHKAFHAKPFAAYTKTGEPVPLATVLEALSRDVKLVSEVAEWHLRSDTRLLDDLDVHTGSANTTGRRLGITIPKDLLDTYRSGRSRYDALLQDRVVREARSWKARREVVDGTSTKYVNQGWRRTARRTAPTDLTPKYSLSAVNAQFAAITNDPLNDGFLSVKMVVEGEWFTLEFPINTERFHEADTFTLPDVHISASGELVFTFTAAYRYVYSPISSRYVIGVDVGRTTYATVSVWDTETNTSVHTSTLSQRVHSLHNSVEATRRQVTSLSKKRRFTEASQHRRANVSKKRELAILAAQEVAELASRYGNAVVVFEDLSWITNTMANGRWNRGEFLKWTEHYHQLNGGRVITVSAHNTSQKCHRCGEQLTFREWKTAVCSTHGEMNRDANASCNVAIRAAPTVSKIVSTRRKASRYTTRRVKRTPEVRESLKFPGRDRTKTTPTPKRPRSRTEVKRECVCSSTGNEDRTVVEDVKVESESPHETVRQHDLNSDRTVLACYRE